jgi:uncharacterized membrane protein
MSYLWLKYLHIIGSTLLFGTGLGTAFHMWCTHRTGDAKGIAIAGRNTVWADWLFTAPAVVLQPVTGFLLAHMGGFPLSSFWIVAAIGLYVLTGACWLPVVWLQIRMAQLAAGAAASGAPLPAAYHRYARFWFWLGWPAFIAVLTIFFLMIFKPES